MNANHLIADLLSAPLRPVWTIEELVEQVVRTIAAQDGDDSQEFVFDADTTRDRQSLRLIRPLLACLASKSAQEAGTSVNVYGGPLSFRRASLQGPVWIVGQFENRSDSARVVLRRSNSPLEETEARPRKSVAPLGAASQRPSAMSGTEEPA